MPKLKYQEEVDEMDCSLDEYEESTREKSFRWVYSNMSNSKNFEPPYQKNKDRPRETCKGWALSFYTSEESAIKRYEHITKDSSDMIYKKLGTHLGIGDINKKDGISNDAGDNGHFGLFEYKNVDLRPKFKIIKKIAPK